MKLIYFTPNFNLQTGTPGVRKKIKGQAAALARFGWEVQLMAGEAFTPTLLGKSFVARCAHFLLNEVRFRAHDRLGYRRAFQEVKRIKPTVIYIRYSYISAAFIRFLNGLRSLEPRPKVMLEIPTWPYDSERKGFEISTWEDRLFRNRLNGLIDRIVTFTDEKKIFGILTIITRNGIDVDSINQCKPINNNSEEFFMLGVANISFWTGYDRMLAGIYAYNKMNKKYRFVFSIIGDGVAINSLRSLSEKYRLQEYVKFLGRSEGSDLDRHFDESHIAVGNLAVHRKNLLNNPDLKNREYCSRGIPFITSTYDDGFAVNFPYMLRVPGDETPIDLEAIASFYGNLRSNSPNYTEKMHQFAKEELDWGIMMKPVDTYLRSAH